MLIMTDVKHDVLIFPSLIIFIVVNSQRQAYHHLKSRHHHIHQRAYFLSFFFFFLFKGIQAHKANPSSSCLGLYKLLSRRMKFSRLVIYKSKNNI